MSLFALPHLRGQPFLWVHRSGSGARLYTILILKVHNVTYCTKYSLCINRIRLFVISKNSFQQNWLKHNIRNCKCTRLLIRICLAVDVKFTIFNSKLLNLKKYSSTNCVHCTVNLKLAFIYICFKSTSL